MDSTELYEAFRSEVSDEAQPYLWKEEEVWRYATDAYRMFVRLTGGIADFTSTASVASISVGDTSVVLDKSILRIMKASLVSDGTDVEIINQTDQALVERGDYGFIVSAASRPKPGPIRQLLIGRQRGLAHTLTIPEADDELRMSIYRLPLTAITAEGQALSEIDEEHHVHLLPWMKHMAYRKHDVETYDLDKSEKYGDEFHGYCAFVKREWDRMKHKNRAVAYGGI